MRFHQDEMKDLELRLHDVIDLQRKELKEREREINLLARDI